MDEPRQAPTAAVPPQSPDYDPFRPAEVTVAPEAASPAAPLPKPQPPPEAPPVLIPLGIIGSIVGFLFGGITAVGAPNLLGAALTVLLGGFWLSSFAFLAMWAVMGRGWGPLRWFACLATAAVIALSSMLSHLRSDYGGRATLQLLLMLPCLLLAAQAPFWILRYWRGYRFVLADGNQPHASRFRQFGIGDLMAVGAVLAVVLSSLRCSDMVGTFDGEAHFMVWRVAAIASGVVALASTLLVVPYFLAYWLPASDNRFVAVAMTWFLDSLFLMLVVAAMTGGYAPGEAMLMPFVLTAGCGFGVCAGQAMLRFAGFRLLRPLWKKPGKESGDRSQKRELGARELGS